MTSYQAEHYRLLNESALTLGHALPRDILTTCVLPYLELPCHIEIVEEDEDYLEVEYSSGGEDTKEDSD